jgi:hypothetical protein
MILSQARSKLSRRSAFTLLEMTIVMWALAIAFAVGVALIFATNKTAELGDSISIHIARHAELARQFRDDVDHAEAAPEQFAEFRAGPSCLILAKPGGSTVVYQRNPESPGSLTRIERTGKKDSVRQLLLDKADAKTEFVRPTEGKGIITLRVKETRVKGKGLDRTSEISAALGGDLRWGYTFAPRFVRALRQFGPLL